MKISKQDALRWFTFFAALPEDQPLGCRQQEIALAVFSQIELAAEARFERLKADIPGLKGLGPGPSTLYVGPEEHFPGGCRSWAGASSRPWAARPGSARPSPSTQPTTT